MFLVDGKFISLKKPIAILCDSAVTEDGDDDGGMDVESTAAASAKEEDSEREFTIVGIAHKKILFNSRPQPRLSGMM